MGLTKDGFSRVERLTEKQQLALRESDLVLAAWVEARAEGASEDFRAMHRERIGDIRDKLITASASGANSSGCLTKPQRGYLFAMAKEFDPHFGDKKLAEMVEDQQDPAERNRHVPRGPEVSIAEVLRQLPLKPPGRGGGFKVQR